jgi:3',5'-cyclic AMP phosphodiesterase CpdA
MAPGAAPTVDPGRFALLADTHIWQHRGQAYRGVKPAENFLQARRQVLALRPAPANLLVAGDCAFLHGDAADYAALVDLTGPARAAGVALHFALGNHDQRENFQRVAARVCGQERPAPLEGRHAAILETPLANWFLLDSLVKTNQTPGELGKAQRAWLGKALDARPDKPALVLAHHYPYLAMPGGLKDAADLLALLVARKQAKAFIFGHSHMWRVAQIEGLHLVNLPAVAWVFDPKEPHGWVDLTLARDGATLVLNSLDPKHAAHGQRVNLKWRPGEQSGKQSRAA